MPKPTELSLLARATALLADRPGLNQEVRDLILDMTSALAKAESNTDKVSLSVSRSRVQVACETAAHIAENDAMGVTLRSRDDYPLVKETGSRIAFNIRALSDKENS